MGEQSWPGSPGPRERGGSAANRRPTRTGAAGRGKGRDAAQTGPRPSGAEGAGHCVVGGASKTEGPEGLGLRWWWWWGDKGGDHALLSAGNGGRAPWCVGLRTKYGFWSVGSGVAETLLTTGFLKHGGRRDRRET